MEIVLNRVLFGFIWWVTFTLALLLVGYILSMVSLKASGTAAIDTFGIKYLGITLFLATIFAFDGARKGILPGTKGCSNEI